jgi:parvulin-like peptidyl-prolyl isomerase
MARESKSRRGKQPMTRKEIAHSRRQLEANRRLLIGLAIVVGLILVVALIGVYDNFVAQPSRPVAIVNGEKITRGEYQDRVVYERWVLDQLITNVQYQLQTIDPNNEENAFLLQYYQQILSQIQQQRMTIDSQVKDNMIDQVLIAQRAAELGLGVSEEEVNEAIGERMAGREGALTQAQATSVAATVAAVTATAETFTPTPSPTAAISMADVVTDTSAQELAEMPTPVPPPTRQVMTDDDLNKTYENYLAEIKAATGFSEAQYRETIRDALLTEKLVQYYADQVPTESEQVNLSQIQTETKEEAQDALARLEAGEAFDAVAVEVSSNERTAEDGGEMGWYLPDELRNLYGEEMQTTAFTIDVGSYSQPITSTLGWQVLKINERTVHPLSEPQLQNVQRNAYNDWLDAARSGGSVEDLWTPEIAPPETSTTGGIPLQ